MLRLVFSGSEGQSADFCQASGHPLQQNWIPDLTAKSFSCKKPTGLWGYSTSPASKKPTATKRVE